MQVIMTMGRKGGSGKSTTSQNMAVMFSQKGYNVAVTDLDPQGTLANWYNRRLESLKDENDIFWCEMDINNPQDMIQNLEENGCDYLIIDTPPTLASLHEQFLEYTDFAIVPCKTSLADIDTIPQVCEMIMKAGVPFGFVLNEIKKNTLNLLSAKEALSNWGSVMGEIPSLNPIQTAESEGLGIVEFDKKSSAVEAYNKVYENLLLKLKIISSGKRKVA